MMVKEMRRTFLQRAQWCPFPFLGSGSQCTVSNPKTGCPYYNMIWLLGYPEFLGARCLNVFIMLTEERKPFRVQGVEVSTLSLSPKPYKIFQKKLQTLNTQKTLNGCERGWLGLQPAPPPPPPPPGLDYPFYGLLIPRSP